MQPGTFLNDSPTKFPNPANFKKIKSTNFRFLKNIYSIKDNFPKLQKSIQ
jgi:hypothetical protein